MERIEKMQEILLLQDEFNTKIVSCLMDLPLKIDLGKSDTEIFRKKANDAIDTATKIKGILQDITGDVVLSPIADDNVC